jgi:hypothetical protein
MARRIVTGLNLPTIGIRSRSTRASRRLVREFIRNLRAYERGVPSHPPERQHPA